MLRERALAGGARGPIEMRARRPVIDCSAGHDGRWTVVAVFADAVRPGGAGGTPGAVFCAVAHGQGTRAVANSPRISRSSRHRARTGLIGGRDDGVSSTADAADDDPAITERGLGDLRDRRRRVVLQGAHAASRPAQEDILRYTPDTTDRHPAGSRLGDRGEPAGFAALSAPFVVRAMRRANEGDLRRRRELLEGR
ncbi:MAG: hypothetical protein ACLGI5_00330 [Thermoleophilia bacterium]